MSIVVGGPVGLFPLADDVWLVKYGPIVLGTIKGRQGFIPIPTRTKYQTCN